MKISSDILDCILIGYNEPDLQTLMTARETMQQISGSYRSMLHQVVQYQGKWYSYIDLLNTILRETTHKESGLHSMEIANLGICYLKSFLNRRSLHVEIINSYKQEKDRLITLLQQEPRTVAITTMFYVENEPIKEIVQCIKQYTPFTTIIVGGPYIFTTCTQQKDTTTQDYLLRDIGADIYINDSQGEATFVRVLRELRKESESNLANIPNLIYKTSLAPSAISTTKKSSFIRTPREPENNALDENPIDWSLFSKRLYTPTSYMRTSRGCAFACAFCNFPIMTGSLCLISLGNIEREMAQLCDAGVKQLVFVDDTLNVPLPRFKKMLRMMIANNFHFQWFSYFRCSHAADETFELMQKSGCKGVFLGIESGDQRILDNMNKQTSLETYQKSISKFHECGIMTYASFIVGFPGETQDSVQNTIHFIEEAQPTYYKANLYYHSHAFPIHRHADRYGLRGNGHGWRHHTMDWQEACAMIEKIYTTVKSSLILPLYMSGFWAIPYLLGKGMPLKQIHEFIKHTQPLLLNNFSSETVPNTEEQDISRKLLALGKEIAQSMEPGIYDVSSHKKTIYPAVTITQRKTSINDLSERLAQLSPEKRALLESRFLKKRDVSKERPEIPKRRIFSPCPLSFAQQRFWFLEQLEPGNPVYNLSPLAVRFTGSLNIMALEQSLNELIRRHEILRTHFSVVDGQPVQILSPSVDFTLTDLDLQSVAEADRELEARQRMVHEAQRPFDMGHAPLFRAMILRLGKEESILLIITHHIVSDGEVIFRELFALYRAFSLGEPHSLPEPPFQYADFAIWQRERLQGDLLEKQLSYWKNQLDGASGILELPIEKARPPIQTYPGAWQAILLSKDLSDALQTLSQQEGATLFMTLLAAFNILLYRYTEQEDIIIGSPCLTYRNIPGIDQVLGFFVNMTAFRANLSGNPPFREVLRRIREMCLGVYAHHDIPFERLIEELNPKRDLSRSPLFQVAFILQNAVDFPLELSGLSIRPFEVNREMSALDMALVMMVDEKGRLRGKIDYNSDLFAATSIKRMAGHFQVLLEHIINNPDQCISDLPFLTNVEHHQLLVAWNNTRVEYSTEGCIHQLFEAQVKRTPEALALVCDGQRLTYRELNSRANHLAHHLCSLGVSPGVMVGICMDRSLDMIVGVLGILKAGGAYIPLDPAWPQARLHHILASFEAQYLVTHPPQQPRCRVLQDQLPALTHVLCLDSSTPDLWRWENPVCPGVTSDHVAYIIYTSGSTGVPKGVVVRHKPVVNLIEWVNKTFQVGLQDRLLFVTSLCFDLSVYDIFGVLAAGASLYVASSAELKDPETLVHLLCHASITFWDSAPAALQQLTPLFPSPAAYDEPAPLRLVFLSGDWIPVSLPDQVRASFPGAQVIGLGGATEAAIWSNYYPIEEVNPRWRSIPYGKPIRNAQYYILNASLNPCPVGVPGGLYIGGECLADGYVQDPEQTAEKFLPDPFRAEPGARFYYTGDLARYLPDGNIEFLGRTDHQVKIRGFRIELGEIETILRQHPAVQQAVVVAREDQSHGKRLVAYVVGAKGNEHRIKSEGQVIEELRIYLKAELPKYMLPSLFVFLDALPVTPNGKIDRKALPEPDTARPNLEETFVASRNSSEERIANIWTEELGVEHIGIYDNFFALGGHSLLATHVISRVNNTFGLEIPLRSLFETPTIAGLASEISSNCLHHQPHS